MIIYHSFFTGNATFFPWTFNIHSVKILQYHNTHTSPKSEVVYFFSPSV